MAACSYHGSVPFIVSPLLSSGSLDASRHRSSLRSVPLLFKLNWVRYPSDEWIRLCM